MEATATQTEVWPLMAVASVAAAFLCLIVGCYGTSLEGMTYLVLSVLLACACLSDLRAMIIPDVLCGAICSLWAVYSVLRIAGFGERADVLQLAGFQQGSISLVAQGFLGSLLACFIVMTCVFAFEKAFGNAGLGGGDIKLLFSCGLFLGLTMTLACLAFACVLAALCTPVRKDARAAFPFGPYLCVSCGVLLLAGPMLFQGSLSLVGLGVLA